MSAPARPAVFLDRDGTLIEEAGYPDRVDRLRFYPYTVDAVRLLTQGGFAVVVLTNQSGVARGIVPEGFVAEAHAHLARRLAAGGARVDGFYHCPHHPGGTLEAYRVECECRKPKPGLILRAAGELSLDLSRSWMVGDRDGDIACGRAAGVRTILVRTGYGSAAESAPDATADTLIGAVARILKDGGRRHG